jgi:hypothetical protein
MGDPAHCLRKRQYCHNGGLNGECNQFDRKNSNHQHRDSYCIVFDRNPHDAPHRAATIESPSMQVK